MGYWAMNHIVVWTWFPQSDTSQEDWDNIPRILSFICNLSRSFQLKKVGNSLHWCNKDKNYGHFPVVAVMLIIIMSLWSWNLTSPFCLNMLHAYNKNYSHYVNSIKSKFPNLRTDKLYAGETTKMRMYTWDKRKYKYFHIFIFI